MDRAFSQRIFAAAGVQPSATIAIFHTSDVPAGYTSLDLSYIENSNIIIALKDNNITLTADRGCLSRWFLMANTAINGQNG